MSDGILVVGFGNALAGDDGAGSAVVARLRVRGTAAGLRAEDGHGDSLRLPSLWRGERRVWLVDALVGGRSPGTVHRLDHDEVLAVPQRHATAHRLSLPESLRWIGVAFPEMAPVRYRLWGIEPRSLERGTGLSPEVARAVEAVVTEIEEAAARA